MSKKEGKVEKTTLPVEMFACLDDKGENYLVQIELPGASKKSIELNMQDDLVQVRAERKDAVLMGHLHFPLKVDAKKADAQFTEGLLGITVPIKEKRPPPVSIKIK